MCGIAGIVGRNRERVARMLDRLAHRGPDARGVLALDALATTLGHVRLSIIDLDARSNQPMRSACGRFAISFNGEIYNYVELRERLEQAGESFRTSSDTEVLMRWIARYGEAGLAALDGMYAFAFADIERRTLLLARDPLGEKPLYYAFHGANDASFAFASELKALLALPEIDTSIDREALADYLRFLYTAAPNTLYRGIRELRPGHVLRLCVDAPCEDTSPFYDLEARTRGELELDREQAVDAFRDAFTSSMQLRLRSDVPVGVFLSSGLDSNTILGVARRLAPRADLDTFTVRFAGSRLARSADESDLAARAAVAQHATNTAITFAQSRDFGDALARTVELFDQPFGNSTSVIADRLAERAAQSCTVCLVGDGGDEILVGYPRHRALLLHQRLRRTPRLLSDALVNGASAFGERGRLATPLRRFKEFARSLGRPLSESFLDWSTYLDSSEAAFALDRREPSRFHAEMLALFERNAADPVRAAALVDLRSFVPHNLMQAADRTSMAHALELRTPFLSLRVIETALRIRTEHKLARGRAKPLLVDAFNDVLPAFLPRRTKRAFNPPIQAFVRQHLAQLDDLLLGPHAHLREHMSEDFVRLQLEGFRRGRCDNSTLLWGLGTLEVWLARKATSVSAAA